MMKILSVLFLMSLMRESTQQVPAPVYNCNDAADVVLVVDASQSVGSNFPVIQNAATAFINEITINNPNIRIALVFYNDVPVQQPFTTSAGTLTAFVNRQIGGSGLTMTNIGIDAALNLLQTRVTLNPANIVVITDAISRQPDQTRLSAERARAAGFRIFALGVNVDPAYRRELFDLTGDGGRIFTLNNVNQISETIVNLGKSICAYTVCSSCLVEAGSRRAPHPTRCDKFYICERRQGDQILKAYEKDCGVGTLWHRRFLTCVPTEVALNDPFAGCGYCDGSKTTFQIADYCQIYYSCGVNNNGQAMLNVNCCPPGLSYNDATGSCVPPTTGTCAPFRYEDKASCRGYYACEGTNSEVWTRGCCSSGQGFNATMAQCEADNTCIGECNEAIRKDCGIFRTHPTDKCQFQVAIGVRIIGLRCPAETSFSLIDCRCTHDPGFCRIVQPPCEPDVIIPVTAGQTAPWGFTESSNERRWIDALRVTYDNSAVILQGYGYITVPFYANNDQAFMSNSQLFRVSVQDDYVGGGPSDRTMTILANTPCPGSFSEAAQPTELPSVLITIKPSTGTVTYSVRTVDQQSLIRSAEITLNYNNNLPAGTWKEVSLRYTRNPGLLEAYLRVYTIDARDDTAAVLQEIPGRNADVFGRILTSDCGMRIGQDVYSPSAFVGKVDNVLFYDNCRTPVPAVDFGRPVGRIP